MDKKQETPREKMTRDSWIRNVMRIYPEKSIEETEELYNKLFVNQAAAIKAIDEYANDQMIKNG